MNPKILRGLDSNEAAQSRLKHGANVLPEIKCDSFWSLWKQALNDRTLKILIGAAVVVIVVDIFQGGAFIEGIAILTAVAVASIVSAWNDWRAQAEFKSLQRERDSIDVRVRRDGKVTLISSYDLVVGDIVELEVGHKIPSDGVLLDSIGVEVDESMLTGESQPVRKEAGDELSAGTILTDGRGVMEIAAVGEETEYGRLRAQLGIPKDPTPLQQRLARLANRIGTMAFGAAVAIFVLLTSVLLVSGGFSLDLAGFRSILSFAVMAVTIVVVAVPEGLPLAVTLSLAYSVMKMAKDKSLVRRLMACETMGAAEVICVDKTGTLTLNHMRVEKAYFGNFEAVNEDPSRASGPNVWTQELFTDIASVNSTAHIDRSEGEMRYIGSPTEGALLEVVESWDRSYQERRERAKVLSTLSFSSDRKMMSTLVLREDGVRLYCKGAAEVVLARCTKIMDERGLRDLDDETRERLDLMLAEWSGQALRPLALAYRDAAAEPASMTSMEEALTLVALVGIGDPIRSEVIDAVSSCRKAGVEVKIITGDALLTAEAVAKRIGALDPDSLIIEGKELRAMSDEDLDRVIAKLRLIARAVPSDKLRIVQALKRRGMVVAVTGDGTNDGPALKHADVGMAMGRSGTDVAREASDIVIVDDNFSSVFKALHWGRTIFSNIRSFLQFQLTVSLVAVSVALIAALTGLGTPLGVMQLLWVNLIMDSVAALALSLNSPSMRTLSPRPHGHSEPIISRPMWINIAGIGSVMLAILLVTLFSSLLVDRSGPAHFTFVFNLFVLMQIFNMFNARVIRLDQRAAEGLGSARLFWMVAAGILVAQFMIVQYGGGFFRTVPLTAGQWMVCLVVASIVIPTGAALRFLGSRFPSFRKLVRLDRMIEIAIASGRRALAWAGEPAHGATLSLLIPLSALSILSGLTIRSLGGGWYRWGYFFFTGGIAAAACWVWERAKAKPWKRIGYRDGVRLQAALSAILAIGIVVQLNYVASRHFRRFDLTASRKFTLSPQSVSVFSNLTHPVRFTTISRPGSLTDDVQNLAAEYKAVGRHVETRHIDPDRDPGEVERIADRLGITNPGLFSMIVEYRGRHRVVPGQELIKRQYSYQGGRRTLVRGAPVLFRGEEALTSAVIVLATEITPRVCFLTGHGERDPEDFGSEGLSSVRDRLRRDGYETETVRLIAGANIPSECRILVQAGPSRSISLSDQRSIEAYLEQGGKWLVALEPWQDGGMADLLRRWGLATRPVYLIDPGSSVAGLGETTLVAGNYQQHPVTSSLVGMPLVFPYATSVHAVESRRPLEAANIVLTSNRGIGRARRQGAGHHEDHEQRDIRAQLAVAAAVNEPPDLYSADGRREPARIVAVGDADFMTNAHVHRSANSDFLMNSIDWLARRDELVGIRARPAEERRIHLSKNAQAAINWTVMGLVPGLVGIFGGLVAWRRRS